MNLYFIISPLSGALIGYVTNWVAIKMLFRPHEEKRIFGFRAPFTPGMIPKRRYILAQKTSLTISEYLLTDETLIERLCGEDVKSKIEGVIDGLLDEAKKSRRTLGSLIFGENYAEAALEQIPACFSGVSFIELAEKLDNGLLSSTQKIGEFLPSGLSVNIKIWISQNIREISEKLLEIVESPFFESNVKPLALSVIRQNIKGLASLFVIPENVYGNFFEWLTEYLNNPENDAATEQKLVSICDWLTEMGISDLASAAAGEDGRIFSAFVERLAEAGDDGGVSAEILKSVGEAAADSFVRTTLSVEAGAFLSKIDGEYYVKLRNAIMSGYDGFVKSNLPYVLAALDLAGIIEAKINGLDMQEAEDIVISVVDRELKAITYFGGLLGFVIGILPPVLQALGLN